MVYSLSGLVKGASLYTVGQILTKGAAFLLLPVLTHYLTPEDFGIIGYVQVIIQLFVVVLMMGVDSAQTRFMHDDKTDHSQQGSFLFTINFFLVLLLTVFYFLFYFFADTVYQYLGSNQISFYPFIVTALFIVSTEIFIQILIGYYVTTRNYKKTITLQLIHFFIATSLTLILVAIFNYGAWGRLLGILSANIIFLFIFYKEYFKKFILKFKVSHVNYATHLGFPIMFHSLGSILLSFSDRIILERYVSLSDLGIYTLGYQLGMIMSVVVVSINKAWQPNYFSIMNSDIDMKDKKYEFRRFFAIWFIVVPIIAFVSILFSKEVIVFILPKEYHGVINIIPLIILGYYFQGIYHILNSIIYFYKKHYLMPFLTFFLVGINVALNFMLIPKIGIYGAAISTIIAFMLQSIIIYMITIKYFNHKSEKVFVFISLLVVVFTIITIFFSIDIYHFMYKVIYVILSLLFIFYNYRQYIDVKSILLRRNLNVKKD